MPYTIDQLSLGQKATIQKTFTEEDVNLFAELSGDMNPVHIDEVKAKESIFGQKVVHGAFVSSLISALLASKLPGEGTIYLGQECKFKAPVFIDDTVTVTCEVIEIIKEKNIAKLECVLLNQKKDIVVIGKATVMPPKLPL